MVLFPRTPKLTVTPSPAPQVTAEPVESYFWLNTRPPAGLKWKKHAARIEAKDIAFSYQLEYPSDWFIYPDASGTVVVQSFPRFESLDQAPPGYNIRHAKIDVGFSFCTKPQDNCELVGQPIIVAGLPAAARAFEWNVAPVQLRQVKIQRGQVLFGIGASLYGSPEWIAYYDQILGYMLSTLQFGP